MSHKVTLSWSPVTPRQPRLSSIEAIIHLNGARARWRWPALDLPMDRIRDGRVRAWSREAAQSRRFRVGGLSAKIAGPAGASKLAKKVLYSSSLVVLLRA